MKEVFPRKCWCGLRLSYVGLGEIAFCPKHGGSFYYEKKGGHRDMATKKTMKKSTKKTSKKK